MTRASISNYMDRLSLLFQFSQVMASTRRLRLPSGLRCDVLKPRSLPTRKRQ